MMAIIASLPLAISALSFLVFSAGSEEVKHLESKVSSIRSTSWGLFPGRPRRKPCRPRSDPILQGWHIGHLSNLHKSVSNMFYRISNHQLDILLQLSFYHNACTNISTVFNGCDMNTYIYIQIYMALILRWIQLFQPCPAAGLNL